MSLSKIVELTLDNAAYGGDTIGRLPDGRAVFVPFAIPGERVSIKIVMDKKKFARGELVEILAAPGNRSQTVTAVCNTLTLDINEINNYLARQQMRIAGGYGQLKDKTFRIAHMGDTR